MEKEKEMEMELAMERPMQRAMKRCRDLGFGDEAALSQRSAEESGNE